jgi:hypothetical protein
VLSQTAPSEAQEHPFTPRQETGSTPPSNENMLALVLRNPPSDPNSRDYSPRSPSPDRLGSGVPSEDHTPVQETVDVNTGPTSRRRGKGRVVYSDDEEGEDYTMREAEGSERSPTPRPQESRQVSFTAFGSPPHITPFPAPLCDPRRHPTYLRILPQPHLRCRPRVDIRTATSGFKEGGIRAICGRRRS